MSRDLGGQRRSRTPVSGSCRAQSPLRLVAATRVASCMRIMKSRDTTAGVRWRRSSGSFVVIVPQHAAQSLAAHDFTCGAAHFFPRLNQPVAKPLVISLRMKMAQELSYGDRQRSFPEENHMVETATSSTVQNPSDAIEQRYSA
jgi:hypothetical protein